MTLAMIAYPGGSHFDTFTPGYDFLRNFWCDLLREPAIDGRPNPTAPRYAQVAMWALGVGLVPFFLALADLSGGSARTRKIIRGLGLAGIAGMLGVALLPSSDYPTLHGLLVTTAGPLGIGAALAGFIAAVRARTLDRLSLHLGLATLSLASLNVLQYAREFYFDVPPSPLLPTVQKFVTLTLLAWMLALGRSWMNLYAQKRDA
ncbi:MAG TPA: hypothetical protein VIM73_01235 [Polyangiaceae bacterium]